MIAAKVAKTIADEPTFAHTLIALAGNSAGGFTFMRKDGSEHRWTFGEISDEARRRGRHFLARGLTRGDRLALVLPDPEDFVLSFLGAISVGVVPVPMSPPLSATRLDAFLAPASHVLAAAGARMILTVPDSVPGMGSLVERVESLEEILDTSMLVPPIGGDDPDPNLISTDDVAFLQFTSGSTDSPRGVRVTHRSLAANTKGIMVDVLRVRDGDVGVSWLPLFHDMGLIGFVLGPLRYRADIVFIPTVNFLKRPSIWLDAIHRHRGTITFAPNFAFSLLTRVGAPADLDLSSLKALGCGAEPISAVTMREFLDRFAVNKLPRTALLPSYGMAEATLGMTFIDLDEELSVDVIEAEPYHASHVAKAAAKPTTAGAEGVTLEFVACGRPFDGHSVRIVDDAGAPLPERSVGEIVFAGESVAAGYFENPAATAFTFGADGLRTGDLGYLAGGQLFVTGRKKDLIIVNGRNYDPHAIERVACEIPEIREGRVAVFSRPGRSTEEIVVVAEARTKDPAALATALRQKIQTELQVPIADVLLLARTRLPRTTSGKIQRAKTRQRYLDGSLAADAGSPDAAD